MFLGGLFTNAVEAFPFLLPGLCGRVAAAYVLLISIPTGCIAASLPTRL